MASATTESAVHNIIERYQAKIAYKRRAVIHFRVRTIDDRTDDAARKSHDVFRTAFETILTDDGWEAIYSDGEKLPTTYWKRFPLPVSELQVNSEIDDKVAAATAFAAKDLSNEWTGIEMFSLAQVGFAWLVVEK